jgi:predicted MPP superfamily phosphohydrolase
VKEGFFNDLEILHEHSGPWDLVLFTGDLVQSGDADDFRKMEGDVLVPLWDKMRQLGSNPKLLAVPGNHDLVRPATKKDAAVKCLLEKGAFWKIADEFYEEPVSRYRQIIDSAFANYSRWWEKTPLKPQKLQGGLLPGEFSVALQLEGFRVGIVGLNTTFLQLARGDYRGQLAWDIRQFNAACTGSPVGDAPRWIAQHDFCLLMTHQGRNWLDNRSSKEVYPEINPAGRFGVHLFGHMHKNIVRGRSLVGGKVSWQWQGNSLFGMGKYGEPPSYARRHGYSAGILQVDGSHRASLRYWPRKANKSNVNGWRFERDGANTVLEDTDGGTPPAEITLNRHSRSRVPLIAPPVLPVDIQAAVDDLRRESILQREMHYEIEFLEEDGDSLWVRITYSQHLINVSSVALDKPSIFSIYSRDYRNLSVWVDGQKYPTDNRPEIVSGDGIQIVTQIHAGASQRTKYSAEVKYGKTDSELFLTVRLCAKYSLLFSDRISQRRGTPCYDVVMHPLHLKRGLNGLRRNIENRVNSFEILIDSTLLPYNGVRLQWRPVCLARKNKGRLKSSALSQNPMRGGRR